MRNNSNVKYLIKLAVATKSYRQYALGNVITYSSLYSGKYMTPEISREVAIKIFHFSFFLITKIKRS